MLSSTSHADSIEFPDSLAILPYQASLLVGLLDCKQCSHKADVSNSLLINQH